MSGWGGNGGLCGSVPAIDEGSVGLGFSWPGVPTAAASKLQATGIAFRFLPEKSTPQPDIELTDGSLNIEITNRWTTQTRHLQDSLEADLAGTDLAVEVRFAEQPARITPDEIARLRNKVAPLAVAGKPFSFTDRVGNPKLAQSSIDLEITGAPANADQTPSSVTIVVTNAALTDHLADVETFIKNKLQDSEKNNQAAAAGPTLLIVEAARTGLAWIRPDNIWQASLQPLLDSAATNFVAIGVAIASTTSNDFRLVTVVSATCPPAARSAIAKVMGALTS